MIRQLHIVAIAFIFCVTAVGAYSAGHKKSEQVMVEQAWARVTIPGRPGAAYANIMNMSDTEDKLVAASTPVAGRTELHTHIKEGNVMKMRPVENIPLPAGATTELKPGGLHIMLFDLTEQLEPGTEFPMTLTFENAGDVSIAVKVQAAGKSQMQHDSSSGHGGHSGHMHKTN